MNKMLKWNTVALPIRNVGTLLVVAMLLATHMLLLFSTKYMECATKVFLRKPNNETYDGKIRSILTPLAQPTIGMGRRRSHSNHFCVGPSIDLPDDDEHKKYGTQKLKNVMRSCHFTDVCFDKKGTLLYYVDEDEQSIDAPSLEEELETCLHGQDYWAGPDHQYPQKKHKSFNKRWWLRPKVKYGPRPQTCTWAPTSLAIPYLPSHVGNFGHCLLDNVMSFYRLLKLFDIYSDEIDFVPLRMIGSDYEPGNEPRTIMLSKLLDPFLGYSMTDSFKTGYFSSYFENHTSFKNGGNEDMEDDACLCFENVVSGKYMHNDHGLDETQHGWMLENKKSTNPFFVGRGDLLRDFRDSYMRRMGLDFDQLEALGCKKGTMENSVVIIPRTPESGTKSGTWDHTVLVQHLTTYFDRKKDAGHAVDTNKITVIDVKTMSLEDQIRTTASAKVLISMRGGGSLLSVFLPKGATLLLLDRNKKFFDDMLYDNIPYFHVVKEPAKSVTDGNGHDDASMHSFDLDSVCRKILKGIGQYDRAVCDQ